MFSSNCFTYIAYVLKNNTCTVKVQYRNAMRTMGTIKHMRRSSTHIVEELR